MMLRSLVLLLLGSVANASLSFPLCPNNLLGQYYVVFGLNLSLPPLLTGLSLDLFGPACESHGLRPANVTEGILPLLLDVISSCLNLLPPILPIKNDKGEKSQEQLALELAVWLNSYQGLPSLYACAALYPDGTYWSDPLLCLNFLLPALCQVPTFAASTTSTTVTSTLTATEGSTSLVTTVFLSTETVVDYFVTRITTVITQGTSTVTTLTTTSTSCSTITRTHTRTISTCCNDHDDHHHHHHSCKPCKTTTTLTTTRTRTRPTRSSSSSSCRTVTKTTTRTVKPTCSDSSSSSCSSSSSSSSSDSDSCPHHHHRRGHHGNECRDCGAKIQEDGSILKGTKVEKAAAVPAKVQQNYVECTTSAGDFHLVRLSLLPTIIPIPLKGAEEAQVAQEAQIDGIAACVSIGAELANVTAPILDNLSSLFNACLILPLTGVVFNSYYGYTPLCAFLSFNGLLVDIGLGLNDEDLLQCSLAGWALCKSGAAIITTSTVPTGPFTTGTTTRTLTNTSLTTVFADVTVTITEDEVLTVTDSSFIPFTSTTSTTAPTTTVTLTSLSVTSCCCNPTVCTTIEQCCNPRPTCDKPGCHRHH